jgi:hypothetical protein
VLTSDRGGVIKSWAISGEGCGTLAVPAQQVHAAGFALPRPVFLGMGRFLVAGSSDGW